MKNGKAQERAEFCSIFLLTLNLPDKTEFSGLYVYHVVPFADFGMLRVKRGYGLIEVTA